MPDEAERIAREIERLRERQIMFRAFIKLWDARSRRKIEREVKADVYINSNVIIPNIPFQFVKDKGYYLGTTPFSKILSEGRYEFRVECVLDGIPHSYIKSVRITNRTRSVNFYFEISAAEGGRGQTNVNVEVLAEGGTAEAYAEARGGLGEAGGISEEKKKPWLHIRSSPMDQVPIKITHENSTENTTTPWSREVEKGSKWRIEITQTEIEYKGKKYIFKRWSDDVEDTIRNVIVIKNTELVAIYEKEKKPILTITSIPDNVDFWLYKGEQLFSNKKTPKKYELDIGRYSIVVKGSITHDNKTFLFDYWEVNGETTDITTPEISINLEEDMTVTAVYKEAEKIEHKTPTGLRTAYQMGTHGVPFGPKRAMYTAMGALEKVQQKPSERVTEEMKRPLLRAAINQGKRWLNRKGAKLYEDVFVPTIERAKSWKKDYIEEKKSLEKELKKLESDIRRIGKEKELNSVLKGLAAGGPEGALGGVIEEIESIISGLTASGINTEHLRDILQRVKDLEDKKENYEKYFKMELEKASAELRDALKDYAQDIAIILARRYKMPVNSSDEQALASQLNTYAMDLAEDLATRGMRGMAPIFRGLKTFSRSTQTVSDIFEDLKIWIKELITGPMILGLILLVALVAMAVFFVGVGTYGIPFQLILALAGGVAVFNLLFNFEDTKYPLDILYHFISGGIIGFDAAFIVICFGVLIGEPVVSMHLFVIGFLILSFLGVFQIYKHGKFQAIVPITFIVILFTYAVIGPYGGITQQYVNQVKEPLRVVYLTVKQGFQDVWLLVTNPSEWYAMQQKRNVQPERPVAFQEGVEYTSLEALPDHVPQGQEFTVVGIIVNKGDQKAKSISVTSSCNINCQEPPQSENQYPIELNKGEGGIIRFGKFKAIGNPRTYAEVTVNVSYKYYTSSNLFVTIMTNNEIMNRQLAGEDVLQPKAATGKVGPAQISLNVGPQPLQSGSKATLLVSVLNNRMEMADVVLKAGTKIIITIPKTIGTPTGCTGAVRTVKDQNLVKNIAGKIFTFGATGQDITEKQMGNQTFYESPDRKSWIIVITTDKDITIKPIESKSIFSFFCDFDVADLAGETTRTDLITAVLGDEKIDPADGYYYTVKKKVTSYISEPLGIVGNCEKDFNGECVSAIEGSGANAKRISGEEACSKKGMSYKSEGLCFKSGEVCCYKPVAGTVGGAGTVIYSKINYDEDKLKLNINNYLVDNAKGTPLENAGNDFFDLGKSYDLDPAFAVAVAMHESGKGTSDACKNKNNCFGIMEGGQIKEFDSIKEGIKYFYENIENYISLGQDTPEKISCFKDGKYAPDQFRNHCYCTREPNKEENTGCPDWVKNVISYRETIQSGAIKTLGSPGNIKFQPGIESQWNDASTQLQEFIICMYNTGKDIGEISSISDSAGMTKCTDDYSRPPCAHDPNSCHYGGTSCRGKSYAVDMGDEGKYNNILEAAQYCNADARILRESDHIHLSIGSIYNCGCDDDLAKVSALSASA